MLAMAQRTADDTVSDARREADKVLGEARQKADQLERETQERHRSVVGNLDSERERLERKIEELRSFEREYRARLKSYLEGQLRDLEGRTEGVQPTAPRPAAASRRPVGLWRVQPQRPCRLRSVRRARHLPFASPSLTPPRRQRRPRRLGAGRRCQRRAGPGVQQPPRPPSPFSSVPPPPVPGRPAAAGRVVRLVGPGRAAAATSRWRVRGRRRSRGPAVAWLRLTLADVRRWSP